MAKPVSQVKLISVWKKELVLTSPEYDGAAGVFDGLRDYFPMTGGTPIEAELTWEANGHKWLLKVEPQEASGHAS